MTQVQEKFEKLNSRSEMEIQFEDHFSENKEYLYNICRSLNSNSREDELIIVHYSTEEKIDLDNLFRDRLFHNGHQRHKKTTSAEKTDLIRSK